MESLRVAYLTTYEPADRRAFSGTGYFMAQSIRNAGCDVVYIGPLTVRRRLRTKLKKLMYRVLMRRTYLRDRELSVLRAFGREASTRLAAQEIDAIVSPSTLPVAFLETDKPVLIWSDATFASIQDFYPQFSRLAEETWKAGTEAEQRALDNATIVAYSSDWAIESAIADYGVERDKLELVSFGANIADPPTSEQVHKSIAGRSSGSCSLVFMGVEWFRKGGDLALDVAQRLNDSGLPTTLTVIGCVPPAGIELPEWVNVEGFINTASAQGAERIAELFGQSHYMLLPSRAECTAIVFCEAAAYGLPSISRDVGGTNSVIASGKTGYVFALDASAAPYVEQILNDFRNYDQYLAMAASARFEYEDRLNWHTAGLRVKALIEGVVAK